MRFVKFILIFICFYSCKEKNVNKDLNNLQVDFDSLSYFNPNSIKSDSFDLYIVTYVNTACPTCLSEIAEFNKLFNKYKNQSCGLRVVCYADDFFEYFKYQCLKGRIKADVGFYLDTAAVFVKANPVLFQNSAASTALVNSKNVILAVGNPLRDKGVLENYLKIIKSKN